MKKTCLIILDGWGIGPKDDSNPIYRANTPNINFIKKNYPAVTLQSSGIAVGLPWSEPGNSEVGHLTIGSGKIIYQHYPRISLAVRSGIFFKNPALTSAFEHAKKNNGRVHIIGLLSEGNVHSSYEHLLALIKMAKIENSEPVCHFFSDGRDSDPQSCLKLLKKFSDDLEKNGSGKIGSLIGRYYALDRRKNWENTKKTYELLLGQAKTTPDLFSYLEEIYKSGTTDPYIEPIIFSQTEETKEEIKIKSNDALIFFDFREDSVRQIVSCFAGKNFENFSLQPLENIKVVTMTEYDKNFNAEPAFPPEKITDNLASVLSQAKVNQLKIAETEKFYHLTYFFNGLTDQVFPGEFRILIPSKESPHSDQNPEMRALEISERLITAMNEGTFEFIAVNYANADTLAHTGNYNATIKGIEILDGEIGKIMTAAEKTDTALIITSDHGNAEKLYDSQTGMKQTEHDPNPVPFYLIDKKFKRNAEKTESEINKDETTSAGALCDIAPTILEIMDIPQPREMTGKSLIKYLVS